MEGNEQTSFVMNNIAASLFPHNHAPCKESFKIGGILIEPIQKKNKSVEDVQANNMLASILNTHFAITIANSKTLYEQSNSSQKPAPVYPNRSKTFNGSGLNQPCKASSWFMLMNNDTWHC